MSIKMSKNNLRDNLICGTLHISTKIIYGVTKNSLIKKFTSRFPFKLRNSDESSSECSFYVKTKLEYQPIDVYAVVKLTDEILHKKPVCTVERYLGNVGDPVAEQLYLTTLCTLRWANNKQFNIDEIKVIDLNPDRHDMTEIPNIYSIDPSGCIDIDDAIHIKQINDSTYEIGIHISDVSSYIPENSILDNELKIRGESVYLTDIITKKQNQVNMLPPKLTEICSLTEHQKKRAHSVIITIKINKTTPSTIEILDTKFIKSFIRVAKNLSYDEAEILIKNDKFDDFSSLLMMYDVGKCLYKQYVSNANDESESYDTHKMVEAYMILANVLSAELLVTKNKYSALLRKHKCPKLVSVSVSVSPIVVPPQITSSEDTNSLISYSRKLMMSRAEYCIGFDENSRHEGLGKDCYTHFTSPIRRYADILVHRMINNHDIVNHLSTVNNLNAVHKIHDVCERLSINLSKLYDAMSKYGDIINVEGKIVSIDPENKKIRILIKDPVIFELNGLDIERRIIEKELDDIICVSGNVNELIISRRGFEEYDVVKLKLFDTINIMIAIVMKNKKKMFTQIMVPHIINSLQLVDVMDASKNVNYTNASTYTTTKIYLSNDSE